MLLFQIFLFVMSAVLGIYSLIVTLTQGPTLFPIILNDLTQMGWNGQFDLDLICFLILSGFWLAWRSQFSWGGIFLGLFTALMGGAFFIPYLLFLTLSARGNVQKLFLGVRYRRNQSAL